MRNYRDTWLKRTEEGKKLVLQYYEIAPKIVESIDKRVEAKEIYEMIYTNMVTPCVEMIEKGRMETALQVYKEMTLKLKEKYC